MSAATLRLASGGLYYISLINLENIKRILKFQFVFSEVNNIFVCLL